MRFEKVSYETWRRDLEKCHISEKWHVDKSESYWEKLYSEIKLPQRATERSACYDFYLPCPINVPDHCSILVPSGIRWIPDDPVQMFGRVFDWELKLYIRSSPAIKHGMRVTTATTIVDADYYLNDKNEGDIMLSLENTWSVMKKYNAGDRVIQGGISLCTFVNNDKPKKKLRTGGIGSTGV